MHATRKLTNAPIREDPWVATATVEAIPTIPIDRGEGRASGPLLLSANGPPHTLQLFYMMLEDGRVSPPLDQAAQTPLPSLLHLADILTALSPCLPSPLRDSQTQESMVLDFQMWPSVQWQQG